jgi:hypothetical protein
MCIVLKPEQMTDSEIYEDGKEAFRRGWKNIPPYSIAAIRRDQKKPSAARMWQDGWSHARQESLTAVEVCGLMLL